MEPDVHPAKVHTSNIPRQQTASCVSPGSYRDNLDYQQAGRPSPKKTTKSDFVRVNAAYVGSVNSVNNMTPPYEPPTSVIREQYWACSRWPHTQRALAIAVGVLLGAVISLTVILILRKDDDDIRRLLQAPFAPD